MRIAPSAIVCTQTSPRLVAREKALMTFMMSRVLYGPDFSFIVSSLYLTTRQPVGGPSSVRPRRGFALLITITLLAFLVLLLVSLASLTRVETAVAANNQVLSQARQQALMGLNIALGQLQAHAGQDSRLTAQANLLGANVGNPWFTGVWTADVAGAPVQRAWLVSGNETNPMRFGPSSILGREGPVPEIALVFDGNGRATNGPESGSPNRVQLVGAVSAVSTGTAMDHGGVVVPGVPVNAEVPGVSGVRTIGRYAFWVGDQGVKASLALADRADEVTYSPWYDTTAATPYDQRARIRQQIATAPTFFRRLGGVEERGFDPLNTDNASRLSRVLTGQHMDMLEPAVATAPLDAFRREFFHTFTDRAAGVLANTLPHAWSQRGLQRDLSQAPALLGDAFVAQSNIAAHMEAPASGSTAVPPITTLNAERRRHRFRAPVTSAATADDPEIEFKVAPVLNSFMLQYRFFRDASAGGRLVLRSRMFVEMWNPYSVALAPETFSLEIEGLPSVQVSIGAAGTPTTLELSNLPAVLQADSSATSMQVDLPFGTGAQADHRSWLPGRVYAWRTESGTPSANLQFYNKGLTVTGWTYPATGILVGLVPGIDDEGNPVSVPDQIRVERNASTTLTVRVKNLAGDVLAVYTSPALPDFAVEDVNDSEENWAFGWAFRLRQPSVFNSDRDWLTTSGRDLRSSHLVSSAFGAFHENLDLEPSSYGGDFSPAGDDMMNYAIFRRASTGSSLAALQSTRSANLDLPVFELPRLPYLSVGELQHLALPANQPFAAGNSWGGAVNSWFDRFFFSGVTAAGGTPNIAAGQPLPNWNLQAFDAQAVTAGALSSRYLLQAGAFNVNSALPEAWRAVLSGVRFSPAHAFRRANIENGSSVTLYTGSQPAPASATAAVVDETLNDGTLSDDTAVGGPAFFRFPQSAQETYFWADTAIEGDFRKQAFRQGVRGGDAAIDGSTLHTLTTAQIDALATAIVTRVREHAAGAGPYASLQAFLAPNAAWGGRNLLERAIADVGINPASISPVSPVADLTDIGFSSLTLTSGDIMTALAPYLRTRSDTFIVRTYGESINPVTQEVSGRAWCEAVVQRLPTPLDSTEVNFAAPDPSGFGRAFRVTQFRWLSPSDI